MTFHAQEAGEPKQQRVALRPSKTIHVLTKEHFKGIEFQNVRDGSTPLCVAAVCNWPRMAKLLIGQGADLGVQHTPRPLPKPLDLARNAGREEMVSLLKAAGATE